MTQYFTSKSDVPILILSIFALLAAAVLSMASMASKTDKASVDLSSNPYYAAESAAKSGVEAARWHIICHGRSEAGGLGTKFAINGATYKVEWSDLNKSDSTIMVRSIGESKLPSNEAYTFTLESKIKIDYMPSHDSEILPEYYARNGPKQVAAR